MDAMDLALRSWRMSDAPALAALLNDAQVQRNLRDGLPYPYTPAHARDFLEQLLAADPDKVFAYAITQAEGVVGSLSVTRQENVHRYSGELGYLLGRSHWGRGIAAWAVKQAVEELFARTDLLRIYAQPLARNLAFCRVLEKAGFQLEGTLRRSAVKEGEVLDTRLYAILRP